MSKKPTAPLRDLDDATVKRRLQPLQASIAEVRRPTRRAKKPARQGIEFQLPVAVIREIKRRAQSREISATSLLLEILRRHKFPVVEEDFVDLRKGGRR
jgi:hypothetical protein